MSSAVALVPGRRTIHAELFAEARSGTPNTCTDWTAAAEKEFLDLARIDVLAAANDHVLDAPDDVAVALRVDRREVSRMHEALRVDAGSRVLAASSQ